MAESVLGPRSGRVAAARKLLRRSVRRAAGLVLLEGPSAVSAALAAGQVRELFVTEAAAGRHPELVGGDLLMADIPVHLVTDAAAASLSETVTPQGIVAVAPLPRTSLDDVLATPPRSGTARTIAVLVEARDPGNAGTIIRTADAAGADAVVLAGDSVDPWSGKCVRASAGSVLHLPIVDAITPEAALEALRRAGCRILAADGHAATDIHDPAASDYLAGDTAWLFGNEAHGLPRSLASSADVSLRVPVYGQAESLNLAAAAAVCLYESARAVRRAREPGESREGVRA